jgi:pimeloyl-ACP methyl ester carboxylesterase
MPELTRPDGVQIHWQARGTGPLVVIAVHWSGHPSVFEPFIEELAGDHRIVTYDTRGTGRSTRTGPHDMETAAADLAAVIDEAGGSAVVVTMTDGCNRAVRAAAEHPDLVTAVVAPGTVPLPRRLLGEADAMVASDSVVEGFLDMLSRDYRAAQRTMMVTANPRMTEAEARDRVKVQVEYCPHETALERVAAWRDDDPLPAARQVGGRLWVLSSPEIGGPWFPAGPKLNALIGRHLPDAHLEQVADGVVSRPDLTAAVVRRITARAMAAPSQGER